VKTIQANTLVKQFLAGIAALFLATTAYTQKLDILGIHPGDNDGGLFFLENADGQQYAVMLDTQEKCLDILKVAEALWKAEKKTIITADGKPKQVLRITCFGAPSNQCPPNVAGCPGFC
jgi:hypothetical protein